MTADDGRIAATTGSGVPRVVFCSAGLLVVLAGLTGCSSTPQQRQQARSSEIGAFTHPKYGKASPRVVEDGQDVPKGGGRDHVGRPYTIAGRTYTPRENPNYSAVGMASWYGVAFHGRRTANGEVFDRQSISAAHPTLPLPSYVRVTNMGNQRSIVVRVNDRGPYHAGRVMDVSERVAQALEFKHLGTARIRVQYLSRAGLAGSDDRRLLASLRTDGAPAELDRTPFGAPILVAGTDAAPARTGTSSPSPAVFTLAAAQNAQSAPLESRAVVSPDTVRDAPVTVVGTLRRDVPLPRPRPFDLDGGTSVQLATALSRADEPSRAPSQAALAPPIQLAQLPDGAPVTAYAPVRATAAALPIATQQVAALYFAPDTGLASRFETVGAMARLKPAEFRPVGPDGNLSVAAGLFRDKANAERVSARVADAGRAVIQQSVLHGAPAYRVTVVALRDAAAADRAVAAARAAGVADAAVIRN